MYDLIKRMIDIVFSLLGVILTFPVWIVTIVGIEISDFGPFLYKASRVGKNNEIFIMYKFRSMRMGKNANEKAFKADVSRIFNFGAFIRKSKIDELPQLINILKGDMSIVGPRPAAVDQMQVVRGGENAIVSHIKPGLTGPSALYDYIYGDTIENEVEYEQIVLPTRLQLDVFYVKNICFLYDLKLVLWTILCIFYIVLNKPTDKILEMITNKT